MKDILIYGTILIWEKMQHAMTTNFPSTYIQAKTVRLMNMLQMQTKFI